MSQPSTPSQMAQQYLRTRVMTATPEQLQLMLYDGAVRFAEAARAALGRQDFEQVFHNVTRAQRIVTEMLTSLKPSVSPDLCGRLANQYRHVFRRLVEVGIDHSLESADDAIAVLKYQRETWAMLLDQLGKQKAAAAARTMSIPAPEARMEMRLSMSA